VLRASRSSLVTSSTSPASSAVTAFALAATGDRGAGSSCDPWADTITPHGKLTITVLGGLAEFERHLILSRTNEGRQRAMANGIKFGPRRKLTKHQRDEVARRNAGEPLVEIAKSYNVSHSTISSSRLMQCHSKVARKKNLQRREIWFCAVTYPPSEHISEVDWQWMGRGARNHVRSAREATKLWRE
jgi:hypothetical protein